MRVLLLCFSFLIVFSVYGCSDHGGDFFVSVIVVSKEELISVSGKDVNSYSLWDYSPSGKSCTIFVQHMDQYSGLLDYHRSLGHELDHCVRGHFHELGATHGEIYGTE